MPKFGGLSLPTVPKRVSITNKAEWNSVRDERRADFYTIGYSGRDIGGFLSVLHDAKVLTLVDVRFTPVSQYKPDFSKKNLSRHLDDHGITYVHRPTLGVPRDIRVRAMVGSRDPIWEWYDEYVTPTFAGRNLHEFFNATEHPIALMCTELDPTECHRHRLALGLERHGLRGYDL